MTRRIARIAGYALTAVVFLIVASMVGTPRRPSAANGPWEVVQVVPGPKFSGQLLELAPVARAFEAQAPVPPDRLAHFAWLKEQLPARPISGWHGTINSIVNKGDGWRVSVTLNPRLAGPGVVFTPDTYTETYHYARGRFRYISGYGAVHAQGLFID